MSIWYLDAAATGSNNGTSRANAWTSVASINLTSILTGDSLYIQGGDYSSEELSIYFPSKNGITFKIDPTATQQAVFKACQIYNGDSCTLDGLLSGQRMIKFIAGANVSGTLYDSIYVRATNTFTIKGVEIDQSAYVPADGRPHHGIGVSGAVRYGTITNNYIHDVITDGINLNNNSDQPSAGIYDWFTITNNTIIGTGDDGCQSAYGGITFTDNYVNQNGNALYAGAHPDGFQLNPDKGAVILARNTVIGYNQSLFIEYATGSDNILIYENLLIGVWPDPLSFNTARGLNYSARAGFTGTFLVANNVFYNFRSFIAANGGVTTGTRVFSNNLFLDCKYVASSTSDDDNFDSSNSYYNSGAQYYDTSAGAVSTPADQFVGSSTNVNPQFTNAAAYNFTLQAGSGAINTGTNLSTYFTTDKSGVAWGTWDRGAFEFGGSDVTNPTVSITGPTTAATYAQASAPLTISGIANDDTALSSVTVAMTGATTGSVTITGTTTWSGATTLNIGTTTLTATATDSSGNTATDSIDITYSPSNRLSRARRALAGCL